MLEKWHPMLIAMVSIVLMAGGLLVPWKRVVDEDELPEGSVDDGKEHRDISVCF
jgi:hypothetical protein